MPTTLTIALTLASFLAGSVPFALLIGLARGVDIRRVGSGNIGATNLTRTLGRAWGFLAFGLDFAKGFVPALTAVLIAARCPRELALAETGWLPVLVGSAAILGHVYPPWLRWRGGKGVATAFGVVTALAWQATLVAGLTWGALYFATRVVSIASLAAAIALPSAVALLPLAPNASRTPALALTIGAATLIIYRHRSNIRRLLSGEEFAFRRRRPSADSNADSNAEDKR